MFSLDFLLCDSCEFVVLERNHGPIPLLCDHGSVYQEFFFFFFSYLSLIFFAAHLQQVEFMFVISANLM